MASRENELSVVLGGIVDAAIALTEADFGNIQGLDSKGCLHILAYRGFPDWWLEFWDTVAAGKGVCGTSLASGERVVVEDVEQSPIFAGTPALEVQRRAGVRAVQSTPIRGSTGQVMGMLSTHYRRTYRRDAKTERILDLLAAHAAAILEREEIERALRVSEERFRLAMEVADEGIWDWNLATGDVYYSPGFARMLGYAPAEINAHVSAWIALLHPDDAPTVVEEVRRHLADPGCYSLEIRIRRKDGTYCWLHSRGQAVEHDAEHRPLRAIGTYIDITERRLANDLLRESENRLRRAQEAAKVGTWEWDVLGDRNHWSDETYRLFGLTPGTVAPTHEAWLAAVFPADRPAVAAAAKDCVARGVPLELEWRTAGQQGEQRWLLSRGHPEFDDEGQAVRYLGVVMDITERKLINLALEHTRNKLADAQQTAHVGSFEYDAETTNTVWSDEQYRIHGLLPGSPSPSPSLTEILNRFILPEDAELLRREFLEAVTQHRNFDHEHRILRPDGEVRWVHTLARPEYDSTGNLLRYAGTTMDITNRKHEEAELKKQDDLMQTLVRHQVAVQTAAAFAHELNQPLLAIAAYNDVALRALTGGKAKTGALARAIRGSHEQALRAGQVLHELIDQLHKGEVVPQPFDLNRLVEAVVAKARRTELRPFRASLELDPTLPSVRGNRLQTEKVLINLIQNGIDAMAEAGVTPLSFAITVRTLGSGTMAHVTVRDEGPGIDAKKAERLFEAFFSTKANGLGLGLPISRSLIEIQGGQLWLDPEDGPGAVFHFTLPLDHA